LLSHTASKSLVFRALCVSADRIPFRSNALTLWE
jgi:hypothetical protein